MDSEDIGFFGLGLARSSLAGWAPRPVHDVAIALTDAAVGKVFRSLSHPATRQFRVRVPASLAPGSYVLTASSSGQRSSR